MIKSRNADVETVAVSAVEGKPLYGGDMLVKPLIRGDEMTFLEIHYTAGVGAPLHTHTHESIAYLVKGKVKSTVGSEEFIMGPGDVCRHPKGVLHGLEAIEDSVVVEIKSPAPEIGAFQLTRPAPLGRALRWGLLSANEQFTCTVVFARKGLRQYPLVHSCRLPALPASGRCGFYKYPSHGNCGNCGNCCWIEFPHFPQFAL